jgi:protein-S-isoprenylcysteine O-methyltransferase Ste14
MTMGNLSEIVFWGFVASWLASALWADRTAGTASWRAQGPLYATGLAFCAMLAAATFAFAFLRERLWPPHLALDVAMIALQLAGIAWCWWARVIIGRLWSGGVVVKEGHRVIDSGPYAAMRHPIYSGAFLVLAPHALVKARPLDLLVCAGFIAFFAAKARVEERFLREQLGEAYERYQERVPMLWPRWRGLRAALR